MEYTEEHFCAPGWRFTASSTGRVLTASINESTSRRRWHAASFFLNKILNICKKRKRLILYIAIIYSNILHYVVKHSILVVFYRIQLGITLKVSTTCTGSSRCLHMKSGSLHLCLVGFVILNKDCLVPQNLYVSVCTLAVLQYQDTTVFLQFVQCLLTTNTDIWLIYLLITRLHKIYQINSKHVKNHFLVSILSLNVSYLSALLCKIMDKFWFKLF